MKKSFLNEILFLSVLLCISVGIFLVAFFSTNTINDYVITNNVVEKDIDFALTHTINVTVVGAVKQQKVYTIGRNSCYGYLFEIIEEENNFDDNADLSGINLKECISSIDCIITIPSL